MDSKPLINDSTADDLVNAYNSLCKDIYPATPKSIKYFKKISQLSNKKRFSGQPILIRNLIILSLSFLALFIITGAFHFVNEPEVRAGILNNQGKELLIILAYLGSISGLGITFYLLHSVTTSIKKMSLVPEDAIYYVSLVVLGIISGFIMSEIFPVTETSTLFNKCALALFGGQCY